MKMDAANKEEALKAIQIADKRFSQGDYAGAKSYALKTQTLYPGLDGIPQMVTTFDVYITAQLTGNSELDYYAILGLKPSVDIEAIKKQYDKMALSLHPDKNKCVGADVAFSLVSQAWASLLGGSVRGSSCDLKRNASLGGGINHADLSSVHAAGLSKCSNLSTSGGNRIDTFWTICNSCKVQYEYLRKYVNKKLSSKNCCEAFIAYETRAGPPIGSYPYSPLSDMPDKGYGGHSFDGVTHVPTSGAYFSNNGAAGYHSGHGYENVSNVPYQGSSSGFVTQKGTTTLSANSVHQANGNVKMGIPKVKSKADKKHGMTHNPVNTNADVSFSFNEPLEVKLSRPEKKRKVAGASCRNGHEEKRSKCASRSTLANGNESTRHGHSLSYKGEVATKPFSMAPTFDARKLLMERARTEIRKKLEEMKLASETATPAVNEREKSQAEAGQVKRGTHTKNILNVSGNQFEHGKTCPVSMTVPDPDFHDFEKDRSEDCFRPKQIWALYDDEDGMPRLYCLIHKVISVNPFKVHISYLGSKTDSEFGSVNWLDSGFTKSCGKFKASHSDFVDQVNIFSHVLSRTKVGRGGSIRIYPSSGDVWAIYRNWSTKCNRSTPDEVRHQYDMVEVLDDYSEEFGVCISPLIKLDGFKTVYKRNTDKCAIRWIRRKEMFCFSHQVPSWLLKGEEASNFPEKSWDLDPAATPDGLLQAATEAKLS